MSDNELRDRIADVVADWVIPGLPPAVVAQAVIDDLGLHYVDSEEYAHAGLGWIEVEKGRHVVGKWEKQ